MDGNSRKSENLEEHLSTDSDGKGSNRESFDVYSYGTKDEMEIDSYGVYNRFKDKGNNNGWIQRRLDRLARDPYCDVRVGRIVESNKRFDGGDKWEARSMSYGEGLLSRNDSYNNNEIDKQGVWVNRDGHDFKGYKNYRILKYGPNSAILRTVTEVGWVTIGANVVPEEAPEVTEQDFINLVDVDYSILTKDEKSVVVDLLWYYRDVFVHVLKEFGQARFPPVDVKLVDDNIKPIRVTSRRISPKHKELIDDMVKQLLALGIIIPSKSGFCAPLVLISKKGEGAGYRVCVDYRLLNNASIKEHFPLPVTEEFLNRVGRCRYKSKFDCYMGYYQLLLAEQSRKLTAFSTDKGNYEFTVLPMGLSNAVGTFQRCMQQVLEDGLGKFSDVHVDDTLVYSENFEDHMEHLRITLEGYRKYKVFIKLKKSVVCPKEMEFLGHCLKEDGIALESVKIQKVKELNIPTTKKQIRRVHGFFNHYRRFVDKFAEIAEPLSRVMGKNSRYEWGDEQQRAFDKLKLIFCSSIVLAYPDFKKPFDLTCDGSGIAMGAVLEQNGRPVAYGSKKFKEAERRWTTTEKETYSILYFMKYWREFLLGNIGVVYGDHDAVRWILKKHDLNELSGRLARWVLDFESFKPFEIKHRPGKSIPHADALSREPFVDEVVSTVGGIKVRSNSISKNKEIEKGSAENLRGVLPMSNVDDLSKDSSFESIIKDLKSGKKLLGVSNQFVLENNILFWTWWSQKDSKKDARLLYVVPEKYREQVIIKIHDTPLGGHLSFRMVYIKLITKVWWPNMWTDIKKMCKSCEVCQKFSGKKLHKEGPLKSVIIKNTLELMGIDLIGPLPETARGNKYILTTMDYFRRWPDGVCISSKHDDMVARGFIESCCRYGFPKRIVSDQGTEFMNKLLDEVCRILIIDRSFSTVYHPQSNGLVERLNKTLKEIIMKVC